MSWTDPFFTGYVTHADDVLLAIERNLRISLNWSAGGRSALRTLQEQVVADEELFVQLIDFLVGHVALAYDWREQANALQRLSRILTEAGAVWRIGQEEGNFYLERRADAGSTAAIDSLRGDASPAAQHLVKAWRAAYGQSPNPGEAYRLAIKAVEDVAIPVVLPKDGQATLGKVISAIRTNPEKWQTVFTRPAGKGHTAATPVGALVDLMGLLWNNQTDRHGTGETPVSISQKQAELAVNLALALVPVFRDGSFRPAV